MPAEVASFPVRRVLFLVAALVLAAGIVAGLFAIASVSLPRVDSLARAAPRETSMMRARRAEARQKGRSFRVDQRWVPYSSISPRLRRAVLIAEDDAFFAHGGLDWNEMRKAARTNVERRRVVRGGSTVTQQLAKNLYLGEERNLLRKFKEMILAVRIERALTKQRIFELYLNLIEWGDGIYGVEAAAQRHFGVSAADLDARQSALLAAVIINPRRFSPVEPVPRIQRRMRMILSRMRRRGFLSEEEYRVALGEAPPSFPWFPWFGPAPEPSPPADSVASPLPDSAPAETLEPVPDEVPSPLPDSLVPPPVPDG